MAREKRDIRPVLLKFGVAFALSLGGILYTLFRNKKIKPNHSQPAQPSQDLGGESHELENDDESLHKTPNSPNSAETSIEKYESSPSKVTSGNSSKDLSLIARYIGDRDGYLLPEFVDLVKECDSTVKVAGISPWNNMETQAHDVESPHGYRYNEHDEPDIEMRNLKSKVKMLQEREMNLEIQLLEYYGLKEQETVVMELQKRLKLNNMEAKLYNLKIESLQANNRRLEAEVADRAKVVTELEAAKAKIKLLRKKLRSEAEQNREQILTLQERVMKLQDQETKGVKNDPEMKYELQKMKELEVDIEDLRKTNQGLKRENSELAQKLEYLQMIATSALDNEETQALKKVVLHLRQQNEDLTKEIERLQADRCSDVEELVYLRWINACLRYELRNYQPACGKTIARDLSKTLSPMESCKKTLPLHHLQNKRVCVDLSCWMVQLHCVNKSHCAMKDKLYLKGLFHRLRALIALNCSLILVTDGSIPAIKLSTYRRRLNLANEDTVDDLDSQKVASVRRNMGSEFSRMVKEAKVLGMALGIPCLDGIEEAEAQCALLNSESLCDGCFTSDSDAFLFGARTVYRDICLGEGGYVVCYEMDDIERKLGFGRNSLITLAVLLGSDYSQGVRGFGPESACQIVKSIGDSAILQRVASEGFSISKQAMGSKKQGYNFAGLRNESYRNKSNLQWDYQLLQVIDAYLKPKCHSVHSDAVHRVLALYPFRCSQLHQICAQYFDWPPEKTDEYILPKIAERHLRRFANLRSTSSGLGVHHALNEMPVKCPVSGIIKQRKHQGRDYFEVHWEDMDGLKQSIVPADLVRSACPERILEFEQRRAQRKKPNSRRSRPKKVETRVDIKEIDQKFQELLLEIEQNNIPPNTAVYSGGSMLKETYTSTKSKSNRGRSEGENNGESSISGFCSIASSDSTTEIIDLTSPAPPVPAIGVSHFQDIKCTDVIELSESENDMSPEHTIKARELRLFISSIRDEIN